jgi:HAD superfamily hydrolase (TIGR01509 family)
MKSISAVLFDVGNVLIRLRPWQDVFPASVKAGGTDLRRALEDLSASEVLLRFERGRASREEFCDEVRRLFSTVLSDLEIQRYYLALLGEPMEGMENLLRDLQSRGVRVAGLSNTSPIHVEALLDYRAVALLEFLVASCEIGHCKPSREAYETAVRMLDVEPGAILFVDDLQENVVGAQAAGLQAVRFESAESLRKRLLAAG